MKKLGPKTKAKAVSLQDVARHCHSNKDRVSWALAGDPRVPEDEAERIRQSAEFLGYKHTLHPDQHFNSNLDQDKADAVIDGIFQNQSLQQISSNTGLSETTAFKLIRGVKVPVDYPEGPNAAEKWRDDVISFMEIALWKGTKRLAISGMDEIDARTLPISTAVVLDKLNVLKGQPQSIHASLSLTMNHKELMNELRPKQAVQINDEHVPED